MLTPFEPSIDVPFEARPFALSPSFVLLQTEPSPRRLSLASTLASSHGLPSLVQALSLAHLEPSAPL